MDYDPEIAAIFSEEAVELLEEAESAMSAWNAAPQDREPAAALRRPLQLLLLAARAWRASPPWANMSHELETLITRIESGLTGSDDSARTVAQEALDEALPAHARGHCFRPRRSAGAGAACPHSCGRLRCGPASAHAATGAGGCVPTACARTNSRPGSASRPFADCTHGASRTHGAGRAHGSHRAGRSQCAHRRYPWSSSCYRRARRCRGS